MKALIAVAGAVFAAWNTCRQGSSIAVHPGLEGTLPFDHARWHRFGLKAGGVLPGSVPILALAALAASPSPRSLVRGLLTVAVGSVVAAWMPNVQTDAQRAINEIAAPAFVAACGILLVCCVLSWLVVRGQCEGQYQSCEISYHMVRRCLEALMMLSAWSVHYDCWSLELVSFWLSVLLSCQQWLLLDRPAGFWHLFSFPLVSFFLAAPFYMPAVVIGSEMLDDPVAEVQGHGLAWRPEGEPLPSSTGKTYTSTVKMLMLLLAGILVQVAPMVERQGTSRCRPRHTGVLHQGCPKKSWFLLGARRFWRLGSSLFCESQKAGQLVLSVAFRNAKGRLGSKRSGAPSKRPAAQEHSMPSKPASVLAVKPSANIASARWKREVVAANAHSSQARRMKDSKSTSSGKANIVEKPVAVHGKSTVSRTPVLSSTIRSRSPTRTTAWAAKSGVCPEAKVADGSTQSCNASAITAIAESTGLTGALKGTLPATLQSAPGDCQPCPQAEQLPGRGSPRLELQARRLRRGSPSPVPPAERERWTRDKVVALNELKMDVRQRGPRRGSWPTPPVELEGWNCDKVAALNEPQMKVRQRRPHSPRPLQPISNANGFNDKQQTLQKRRSLNNDAPGDSGQQARKENVPPAKQEESLKEAVSVDRRRCQPSDGCTATTIGSLVESNSTALSSNLQACGGKRLQPRSIAFQAPEKKFDVFVDPEFAQADSCNSGAANSLDFMDMVERGHKDVMAALDQRLQAARLLRAMWQQGDRPALRHALGAGSLSCLPEQAWLQAEAAVGAA